MNVNITFPLENILSSLGDLKVGQFPFYTGKHSNIYVMKRTAKHLNKEQTETIEKGSLCPSGGSQA